MQYVALFGAFFIVPPALAEGNGLVVVIGACLAFAGLVLGDAK